jgi:hypothetical protein
MSRKIHMKHRHSVIRRLLRSLPALGIALTLQAMQPVGAAEAAERLAAAKVVDGPARSVASPRLVTPPGKAAPKRTLVKRVVKPVADEGGDLAPEAASNPSGPADDRITCQAGCGASPASDTSAPSSTAAASDPGEAEAGNALSCLAGCYAGGHAISLAKSTAAAMPASPPDPAAADHAEMSLPKRATSSASRHLVKRHVLGGSGDWFRRINRDRAGPATR